MAYGTQCQIHKGSPIIPILSKINPIPCIDTYLFKVYSTIVLHLRLGLPKGLFPVGLLVDVDVTANQQIWKKNFVRKLTLTFLIFYRYFIFYG
jgi:hypothetical protein